MLREKLLLLAILNRSRFSHLSQEFNGFALHLSLKWISFIQALSTVVYTLASLLSSIVWIRAWYSGEFTNSIRDSLQCPGCDCESGINTDLNRL